MVLASDNITVSVELESNVVVVGGVFTVNLSIANVPSDGLYAYEFKLTYNSNVLEGINVTLPEGHFLTPEQPGKIYAWCKINQSEGYIYIGVTLMGAEPGKVGNGTLVTMIFKAKSLGSSTLSNPYPYPILQPPYSVIYENVDVVDGFVEVVASDLNSDGKVNIEDLILAAMAFGSYPGHPDWNPLADVNRDDVINIRDVTLIARTFGKTL